MITALLSKLFSESILSIVPSFIKSINIDFFDKYFLRFLFFVIISFFFVNNEIIQKYIISKEGLILGIITIIHVISSYRGYELLKGGVANSIFYMYPIFILYFTNYELKWQYFILLFGLYLLAKGNIQQELKRKFLTKEEKCFFKIYKTIENYPYEGVLNMIVASITEAMIYFFILKIKTNNHWNHIFISYFIGFVLISVFYYKKIIDIKVDKKLAMTSFFYIFILLIGYYLRFYAINRLNANYYSILSYIGILLTYFNSWVFKIKRKGKYNEYRWYIFNYFRKYFVT